MRHKTSFAGFNWESLKVQAVVKLHIQMQMSNRRGVCSD